MTRLPLLLACALALAACDTGGSDPLLTGLFDNADFAADANELTPNWRWTRPGMRCRDGSVTGFMFRPVPNSKRLLIVLQGGGSCSTPETCSRSRSSFERGDAFGLVRRAEGVLSDDAANPFAEWNKVVVPYCSGDVHRGTLREGSVAGVGPQQFEGARNLDTVLEVIGESAEGAEVVVLAGASAGAIGATLAYGDVAASLAPAPVHLLADSGPIVPDTAVVDAALQRAWIETWGLETPPGCLDCEIDRGPGLGAYLPFFTRRYPDRSFGLVTHANDPAIRTLFGAVGPGCADERLPDCKLSPGVFADGLATLRGSLPSDRAGVLVLPGQGHTSILQDEFFVEAADGTALRDWVAALAMGGAVPDVGAP